MTAPRPVGAAANGNETSADEAHGTDAPAVHPYWEASQFGTTLLAEFRAGLASDRPAIARERFYVLARYFRRTLAILHDAFARRDEALAGAALRNVLVLQRILGEMHRAAPDLAPSTLALETPLHERIDRDLAHEVLRDAAHPLDPQGVLDRFNELDVIGDLRLPAVNQALMSLVATGHAVERGGRFAATAQPYIDVDVGRAGLAMLVGPLLADALAGAGIEGLPGLLERQRDFVAALAAATGFGEATATLVIACAEAIARPVRAVRGRTLGEAHDLAGSAWPRPYQRLIHAILRARRYAGQVVEAPNGSGKTLIGMLCIQDWLDELGPGESVLVLVPSVNYQEQWLTELCLRPSGLRLQPHLVQAGTPPSLQRSRERGALPRVLLVTYAALARWAAGEGRGGFDPGEVERFLQCHGVRHVILDEVHKVVADMASPTAASVRVLVDWLRDGSLAGLVGFSATLVGLESRLTTIGLELACVLPPADLIAQGWVAPFAELGLPFAWSARERAIATLVDEYRAGIRAYLAALGDAWLRARFAAIPLEVRTTVARRLGMYAGRADAETRIRHRVAAFERGEALGLDELALVAILQAALGWTDGALLDAAGRPGELPAWSQRFERIRVALRPLLPPGAVRQRLDATGFGLTGETPALPDGSVPGAPAGEAAHPRTAHGASASTFVGLYLGLRGWYRQAGEGRVGVVRAAISAERACRDIPGVVVFDTPGSFRGSDGVSSPGHGGAAGLYVELLEDPALVAIAAMRDGIYLPDVAADQLSARIGRWIANVAIRNEGGSELLALLTATGAVDGSAAAAMRSAVERGFARYTEELARAAESPARSFRRAVLRPVRAVVRGLSAGPRRRHALALLASTRLHPHVRSVFRATIDYARIARAFDAAQPVDVVRADGSRRTIRRVAMPGGDARQRAYALVARIVDAPELPVNVVVVTAWARTGWNVTSPNVLIDATATRDVIAWQQLRGRAMRPVPGWSIDAQRLLERLEPGGEPGQRGVANATPIVGRGSSRPESAPQPSPPVTASPLSAEQRRLVARALPAQGDPHLAWFECLAAGSVVPEELPPDIAVHVAARLLVVHNKVAHVYELLRGQGSGRQVRYDRRGRRWERVDAIAAKHRAEWSVRPSDGAWLSGPDHAPLVIAGDPRVDTPAEVEGRLRDQLAGGDEVIVRGWLRATGRGDG